MNTVQLSKAKTFMSSTIQLRTVGRLKKTTQESEIITVMFHLGPIRIICIVNIPPEGKDQAPAYVKIELAKTQDSWTEAPDESLRDG
jgi:hypothetical protein